MTTIVQLCSCPICKGHSPIYLTIAYKIGGIFSWWDYKKQEMQTEE